jgi:hypothetical protein
MSDIEKQPVLTPEQTLQNVEQIRDLFARAHDYIQQAQYPGHMALKLAEVTNFLKFQHDDFKQRGEKMAAQIEADRKAKLSVVDVEAAQKAVDAVLVEEKAPEAPQAQ